MRSVHWAVAVMSVGVATVSMGAVVTDNNLKVQDLGTLTAGPSVGTVSFEVTPGLYGVSATVASDGGGVDISGYVIDALSPNATLPVPLASDDTISRITWSRTNGAAYGPKLHSHVGVATTSTTMYYHLGVGRASDGSKGNYKWMASNVIAFEATGADNGNLVPNASFENPAAAVFRNDNNEYGEFVDDPNAPHGTKVLKNTSTRDLHVAIPVVPGYEVSYSFWAALTGTSAQLEIGFSRPENGNAAGAGNQTVLWSGNKAWTEISGTMTPAEGQTVFYIGGMANAAELLFDSIWVTQAVPEPGAAIGAAAMGALALLRRRWA